MICILYSDIFFSIFRPVGRGQNHSTTSHSLSNAGYHIQQKKKLNIACNSDGLLYINQLTLKDLGQQSTRTADNESECQGTSVSSCFRSVPSDIPWNYTFYRKVSKICNGKHNCNLESRDFVSYVTQFRDQFTCSNRGPFYYTRIGCFFWMFSK